MGVLNLIAFTPFLQRARGIITERAKDHEIEVVVPMPIVKPKRFIEALALVIDSLEGRWAP